jgi:hypothetical protein
LKKKKKQQTGRDTLWQVEAKAAEASKPLGHHEPGTNPFSLNGDGHKLQSRQKQESRPERRPFQHGFAYLLVEDAPYSDVGVGGLD